VIFACIRDHLVPQFTVLDCCRVLKVSRSGYYRWLSHPVGQREVQKVQLLEHIKRVHEHSRRTYGAPRIHQALRHRGIIRNRKTIARIMRENRIKSKIARRFKVRTTDSNHAYATASNHLDRRFNVAAANAVWLCDITYIPTAEGFLYLAGVMDLFSRRIVGWSMACHLRQELVEAALQMAIRQRDPKPGLIHHSDRGVQYCSGEYRRLMETWGLSASMSRTGDCYDNAPKESFWATLKKELMSDVRFATREEARAAIFEYIEVFYNRQRIHSSLGYVSPEQFEASRS
jgi:putative transposase